MKIVVLDGYTENPGDLSWEGLQELGELTVYDRTPVGDTAEIIRRIGDAQACLLYTSSREYAIKHMSRAEKEHLIKKTGFQRTS